MFLMMSPLTQDKTSPWPLIILIIAAVAIAGVLLLTRKKN